MSQQFNGCSVTKSSFDFENVAQTTTTCAGKSYAGGFESAGAGAKLSRSIFVGSHYALTIKFKLALFDTWEAENFVVKIDGAAT